MNPYKKNNNRKLRKDIGSEVEKIPSGELIYTELIAKAVIHRNRLITNTRVSQYLKERDDVQYLGRGKGWRKVDNDRDPVLATESS